MYRTTLAGLSAAALLTTGSLLLPASAIAAPHAAAAPTAVAPAPSPVPVTGTLADGTAFTGQISDLTASVVDGVLSVTGTLTGTGLPAGGTTFTAPVQALDAAGACQILTLDLGRLHLDLLGLVVDLAPVHLDVTAVPGNGKLLGNLLCAVAGLLDRTGGTGGALNGITNLLNRLLTGLGL